MKLKIKLPGAAGQTPAGTSSQAEPSTSTVTPLAQTTAATAATPIRKRKEPSMGGAAADVPEPESYGPPLKRTSIAPPSQPPSASGASMPPPRLKISFSGARAAAAAAAAAAGANTPGLGSSALTPSPRLPASAGPSPAAGFGLGPGIASRSAHPGQAPLPSPLTAPASAPRGPAPAAAKGRLSEEARRIAMQVNEAFGAAVDRPVTPVPAADAALPGGSAAGSKPGPGPAALPPGPLVAPLPSGEGTTIKKIKLSVKMPNLASLAARIARGEPTGPEEGAAGSGAPNAGGGGGAGPAARPAHDGGEGPRLGAAAPTLVGAAAPVGPPRLPFKVKVRLPSLATGGLSAPPAAAVTGGPGVVATTTTIKPLIITTTRPAPTAKATAAAAAEATDSSDDEDDDYGPDPEFAVPRRGRGRGRGRGPRGAGMAGRGPAVGLSRGASVSSVSASIGRSAPPMMPPVGGRGRGRTSDHASRFDLERCFEQIVKQDKDGLFAKPVTDEVAPGYSEVINNPIDLSVIRERMRDGNYDTWASLEADLLLMTNNAKTYNPLGSTAWWHADLMEKMTLKYVSCGRSGMQNYRGVAASVWRDLRKPAEGASAIPLLPRYTSAGPRLDKNGNERDPAERRRQQQETAAEASSLMLESRLRERRPGPGALRDDLFWPGGPEPRVGGVPAGVGGPLGVLGPGAAGPSGFAAGVLGAGPGGLGRRKHRNQGIRMIEADARRLMAAQAGDNRFSYRSKPPASVAPFVLLGGLAAGASPEGLPFAVLRPSLAPATLPCDPPAHTYAASLVRFIAKCGKAVQMAALKRLAEPPPPPPPPPPPQPVVPVQQTFLDPQSPPQQPAYPQEHSQLPFAPQPHGAGQGQQYQQHTAAASWLPSGQQPQPPQQQELQVPQSVQGSYTVSGLHAGSPQPLTSGPMGGAGMTSSTPQAPSQQQQAVGVAQPVGGQGMTLYPLPVQQQQPQLQQQQLQQQTQQYPYLPQQQQPQLQQSQQQQLQAPSGGAAVGSPPGGQYYPNPTQQLQQPQQYQHHTPHLQQPQLQQPTPSQQQPPNAYTVQQPTLASSLPNTQAPNHSQTQPAQTPIQPHQPSSAALAPTQQQQPPYLVPQTQPQAHQQPSGPFTSLPEQQYAQPPQQQQHPTYQSQSQQPQSAMPVGSMPMQLGSGPGPMQQQQGASMHPGPMQAGGGAQTGHVNQPGAFTLPSPGMSSYSTHAPG